MNDDFPKRNKSHITDENGQNLLRSLLPAEWFAIFSQGREYGTDLEVEIPVGGEMKANIFKGQLKTHELLKINQNNTISQYIKYTNWNNWQRQPTPFFLFVADLNGNKVYWLNIKTAEIEFKVGQEGTTIHIPIYNDLSNELSLNHLISGVIIELERDEKEYLELIEIPTQFEEIDNKSNISRDSLKIALIFVRKLFYLYNYRKRIVYYFKDRKGLKRFLLILQTTYSEMAIELIHSLLEKHSSSLEYLFDLSYILTLGGEFDSAFQVLKKGIEIAKNSANKQFEIKMKVRLLLLDYIKDFQIDTKKIFNFFSEYTVREIKSNLNILECSSLINFLGKIQINQDIKKADSLFKYALTILNSIEEKSSPKDSIKATILSHQSVVYHRLGDKRKAISILHKALIINLKNGQIENAAKKYNRLSEMYYFSRRYKKGLYYACNGLKLIEDLFFSDIRLEISLKFSYFINLVEFSSQIDLIEDCFNSLIFEIEENLNYDYSFQYFTVIEAYFYKLNDLRRGLQFVEDKVSIFIEFERTEIIVKIINLLKLLKYTFKFNLNQLTFDELSDVLGTMNFEEGFETNEFLFALWNSFMDYLEETVSNYIIQGKIIWIHIGPFYFFEKIRQLLQQIGEHT